MNIQLIDQEQFNKIDVSRQIIVHEYPSQFACIDLGEKIGKYGINWNSELIESFCKISPDYKTIWLGVEQKLVAICCSRGNILLALPLTSYLIQLLPLETMTIVLTEQEIMILNCRGSIRYSKALPDVAVGMSCQDNHILIELSYGESLILDLNTGHLESAKTLMISSLS